jgi:hypothetical protein
MCALTRLRLYAGRAPRDVYAWEVRDYPDDLPLVFHTPEGAAACALRRARAIGEVLVYEIGEFGERYLGAVEA